MFQTHPSIRWRNVYVMNQNTEEQLFLLSVYVLQYDGNSLVSYIETHNLQLENLDT